MHPTLASSPHLATPQSNQGTSRATGGQLRPTAIEPLPSVCCHRNHDQPGMDVCLSRLSVGVGTRCSNLWPPARNQVPHPSFVVAQFPPRSWRAKRSPLWISMRGCRLRLAHGCGPPRTTHHAACAAANASTSSYNGAPRTPASNYHSRSARHAPPCPQTVHDARIHTHTPVTGACRNLPPLSALNLSAPHPVPRTCALHAGTTAIYVAWRSVTTAPESD